MPPALHAAGFEQVDDLFVGPAGLGGVVEIEAERVCSLPAPARPVNCSTV